MIGRRAFVTGLALGLLARPLTAHAQPAEKMYRVGILSSSPSAGSRFAELLEQNLRDLGYVEGRNLALEWRSVDGTPEGFDDLAVELVRRKVDVIVASVPAAVFAAKRATTMIPIVMVNTPDPVQLGVVASLGRPGGNITGVTSLSVDLSVKQLQLLREAVPRAPRIAVLSNPTNPWHPLAVKGVEAGARSLRVQLQILHVRGPEEFDHAFAAMGREGSGAVLVLADPMAVFHRSRLADLAARHRLPAMYGPREHTEAGGLMSYWADSVDLYRRAASYVDRILKGAKPGDLPIEQPTKYELVINLKTARALGLTIPQSMLLRADRVIE